MQSLRDLLIFVLCGFALIVWGFITLLSPGAADITSAGSPYWTIPLGALMIAAGFAVRSIARRRRGTAAPGRTETEAAAAGTEDESRGPGDAAPPAP
ncbi:hypothetical protein GCM10027570_30620 [Streptomonospora sediminis]